MLAMLYLSLFGSVIAFLAYYYLIKRMDATMVSLSTLVIPIVALALGRAFLGETVRPAAVVGILMILAGVGIAILPRWERASRRKMAADLDRKGACP
jgi:drug/metabolite transporter (DMT)-like permease